MRDVPAASHHTDEAERGTQQRRQRCGHAGCVVIRENRAAVRQEIQPIDPARRRVVLAEDSIPARLDEHRVVSESPKLAA